MGEGMVEIMDKGWLNFSKELHEDSPFSYVDFVARIGSTIGLRVGSWIICLPLFVTLISSCFVLFTCDVRGMSFEIHIFELPPQHSCAIRRLLGTHWLEAFFVSFARMVATCFALGLGGKFFGSQFEEFLA